MRKRILLIGPPPYMEGGARVSFDLMHQYMRKSPALMIHALDLPVHHPLYGESGQPSPVNHLRTVFRCLRAASLVPCFDNVVIFGSVDVCFSYGLVLMLCAKLFRKRFAVRFTGGRAVFSTQLLPVPARAACLALAGMGVDVIVTETEVARNDLPARLRSKAVVVYGYRPKVAPASSERCCPGKGVRFIFMNRPEAAYTQLPEKGLDVLLEAVERIRGAVNVDIEVHVYGPVHPAFAERIHRAGEVTAHGFLNNARLRDVLAHNDVLVFPSRYAFEGHPGAIIEAFMAGLPVVASDLPGPSEIVMV